MISDSDSENEMFRKNFFGASQNESKMIQPRGTLMNSVGSASCSSFNTRGNILASTKNNNTREFGMRGVSEYSFKLSNNWQRRATSPMSMCSMPSYQPRHFQNSYYPNAPSSQRSMSHVRHGSSMSVQSLDSNTSILSAKDIVSIIKNTNFNKHEQTLIKKACNKYFKKNRVRRSIEKRRHMRYMKRSHRQLGYDSGEQADSSLSDNDCRSVQSGVTNCKGRMDRGKSFYKENAPYDWANDDSRSKKRKISDFTKSIRESDIVKDSSKSLTFKNMFSIPPTNAVKITDIPKNDYDLPKKNGLPNGLPQTRQNRTNILHSISENKNTCNHVTSSSENNNNHVHLDSYEILKNKPPNSAYTETESEEEIFSNITVKERRSYKKPETTQQRSLEDPDEQLTSNCKKSKITLPMKLNTSNQIKQKNQDDKPNDFEFIKPQFPIRKLVSDRNNKEVLISKSSQPLTAMVQNVQRPEILAKISAEIPTNNDSEQLQTEKQSDTLQSYSDVSMRPSFMKRKLFTQTLDVTEIKNVSCENLATNSPQTKIYSSLPGEKNKPRKLVTTQSCLRRDDLQENSNDLMSLIHKIVPKDQINTNTTVSRTKAKTFEDLAKSVGDKKSSEVWDITSFTCNNDNASETYTDEDIIDVDKEINKTKGKNNIDQKSTSIVKVVVCRLDAHKISPKNKQTCTQETDTNRKYRYNNSFWNTDVESDLEDPSTFKGNKLGPTKQKHSAETSRQLHSTGSTTTFNGTIASAQQKKTNVHNSCGNKNISSVKQDNKGTQSDITDIDNNRVNTGIKRKRKQINTSVASNEPKTKKAAINSKKESPKSNKKNEISKLETAKSKLPSKTKHVTDTPIQPSKKNTRKIIEKKVTPVRKSPRTKVNKCLEPSKTDPGNNSSLQLNTTRSLRSRDIVISFIENNKNGRSRRNRTCSCITPESVTSKKKRSNKKSNSNVSKTLLDKTSNTKSEVSFSLPSNTPLCRKRITRKMNT